MVLSPEVVDALDDQLVAIQRIPRRRKYRQQTIDILGLPGGVSTFRTLRAVERLLPDAPTIGEVAEAMGIDPSAVSRSVDRGLSLGLLTRETHDSDRRKAQLELTDAGHEVLETVTLSRRTLLADVISGWEEDEVMHLAEQLRRLLEGYDRVVPLNAQTVIQPRLGVVAERAM